MFSNILIVVSATVSILVVLDFYMSDAQKKLLSEKTQELWNRLDDLSQLPFMDFIRDRAIQRWIAWTAAVAAFALFGFMMGGFGVLAPTELLMIVLLLILFGWLGPRLMTFALGRKSALQVILRTAAIAAGYVAIVAGIIAAMSALLPPQRGGLVPENMEYIFPALLFIWFAAIVLILTVLAPLAFVFVAKAVLSALELTVRRIAESPKGPVLATSTLLGGAVAVIKIFS